jgi:chromosome segregation ATPase
VISYSSLFVNDIAIQELQSNIGQLMRERDEAHANTNEKDHQLVELRREVNNVIDKKKRLEQELDRLKHHLVSVEEGYTQEAIESEEPEWELRKKLQVCMVAELSLTNFS